MRQLKLKNLHLLKRADYSVVLIYANGCLHCETVKPIYKALEKEYREEIAFYKAEINDIKALYETYAEKQPAMSQTESGEVSEILDESGNPVMVPTYIIPNFFVFAHELQGDEDEYGFAGGFDGANPNELEAVLQALQNKSLTNVES